MKRTIPYSIFILSVFSCTEKKNMLPREGNISKIKGATKTPVRNTSESTDSQFFQKYIGILPCASCEGIETELILYNDSYELKEVYIGDEGSVPSVEKGKLAVERGFENDKDATLYILNPDKPVFRNYYVSFTGNNNLIKLDRDMKIIGSDDNYSLKKVEI